MSRNDVQNISIKYGSKYAQIYDQFQKKNLTLASVRGNGLCGFHAVMGCFLSKCNQKDLDVMKLNIDTFLGKDTCGPINTWNMKEKRMQFILEMQDYLDNIYQIFIKKYKEFQFYQIDMMTGYQLLQLQNNTNLNQLTNHIFQQFIYMIGLREIYIFHSKNQTFEKYEAYDSFYEGNIDNTIINIRIEIVSFNENNNNNSDTHYYSTLYNV